MGEGTGRPNRFYQRPLLPPLNKRLLHVFIVTIFGQDDRIPRNESSQNSDDVIAQDKIQVKDCVPKIFPIVNVPTKIINIQ